MEMVRQLLQAEYDSRHSKSSLTSLDWLDFLDILANSKPEQCVQNVHETFFKSRKEYLDQRADIGENNDSHTKDVLQIMRATQYHPYFLYKIGVNHYNDESERFQAIFYYIFTNFEFFQDISFELKNLYDSINQYQEL